jgi:hypothetical protein
LAPLFFACVVNAMQPLYCPTIHRSFFMRQLYVTWILSLCSASTVVTAYEPAIVYGPFESIQVNVDATGADVEADSANEPSIAISTVDPSKIAIGWRQFDQTTPEANYFAGTAHSTDGGRTWSTLNYVDVLAGLPKIDSPV